MKFSRTVFFIEHTWWLLLVFSASKERRVFFEVCARQKLWKFNSVFFYSQLYEGQYSVIKWGFCKVISGIFAKVGFYYWANLSELINFFHSIYCLEISQNSQENTCARVSFLIKLQAWDSFLIKKFCEISKDTFFTEHLWEIEVNYLF